MPRGDWISNLAVGLAAIAAGLTAYFLYDHASELQGVYEHQAVQKTQYYKDAARIRANRRCVPLPRPEIRQCVHEEYNAARQREHDEYDLQAQLVTSAWTRAMGIAAIIGMSVGILGVGLVFFTFRETRNANKIAREALEGQLRPWVKARFAEVHGFRMVNRRPHFRIGVRLDNVGQSPALGLAYAAFIYFGDDPTADVDETIKHVESDHESWATANLFHGDHIANDVSCDHEGEPLTQPVKVWFHIVAIYRTSFSPVFRHTAVVYEILDLSRDDGLIDFANPPFGSTLRLRAPDGFIGYAT